VQSPGDNFLRERVRLERVVAGVGELHTGPLRIETVAVSTSSFDGSLPRVPAAVVLNLADVVGSPQPSQSGWIYIGSFDGGEWKHQALDVGRTLPSRERFWLLVRAFSCGRRSQNRDSSMVTMSDE